MFCWFCLLCTCTDNNSTVVLLKIKYKTMIEMGSVMLRNLEHKSRYYTTVHYIQLKATQSVFLYIIHNYSSYCNSEIRF